MDDFPIKTSIYKGFSIAMLNNQMVILRTIYVCITDHEAWKNVDLDGWLQSLMITIAHYKL